MDIVIKEFGDFTLLKGRDRSTMADISKCLRSSYRDQFDEIISTTTEILVKAKTDIDWMSLAMEESESRVSKLYRFPIYFTENDDWATIEAVSGMDKPAYIKKLISGRYRLDMFGFVPGFLYLGGLDKTMRCPRKNNPSKEIHKNTLAVGGEYLGFYSLTTPSGWHVLGLCPLDILHLEKSPPIILQQGDEIEIVPISRKEYRQISQLNLTLNAYNEGV